MVSEVKGLWHEWVQPGTKWKDIGVIEKVEGSIVSFVGSSRTASVSRLIKCAPMIVENPFSKFAEAIIHKNNILVSDTYGIIKVPCKIELAFDRIFFTSEGMTVAVISSENIKAFVEVGNDIIVKFDRGSIRLEAI